MEYFLNLKYYTIVIQNEDNAPYEVPLYPIEAHQNKQHMENKLQAR